MTDTNTTKRQCKVCDCKTIHFATEQGWNTPFWLCLNCYTETPRIVRKPSAAKAAKMAAVDALFETLTQEAK